MRIVVVGATGNLGTALLTRLQSEPAVTQIVGVARRVPNTAAAPYSAVEWHPLDIADDRATERLATVFAGADAVVHLGWALQPNRDEATLWRTNVTGTRAILAAVARAGVPHILAASSVGAYSAGPKHRRVDENWPTGGLHTSHYSRHKAVNERAFERFEAENPGVRVTLMRPGLVFQRRAAAELHGLFLGPLLPTGWLGLIRPPVVPLPVQTIFQAVHASDVADAFCRAIDRREAGAFNLAAEPVLTPPLIAEALGASRSVPVRLAAARLLVWATWKLRLQPTDPGWIDIAAGVPVMSTERARTVLGWSPQVSATDALAEVVQGLADGSRVMASPPLSGQHSPRSRG
ncbi:NAD-dependent epimerase/dehydratase family protein [Subtercola vilae]|uniref:NAD-dependent epimerase/dehydratase family protein n=1 Tax=Subtercola vilae TaxID=2056433 RepID=A0A4T2C565_9MICO|nr:NAD-dependent epimerase/dehydratase family protein [Subtercola vilae]TIH39307.1 NAD-dependent epimerase/dehydratase family protein [Subtercola vilae]